MGESVSVGSGTAGDGTGTASFGIGLQSEVMDTPPKITGDRSMVLFFGGTYNQNSGYDFTADDKFALIGGEFQIDDASGSGNKGCVRYNSAAGQLQLSNDCTNYTAVGGTPAGTPSSSSAACTAGQTSYDSSYVYVCVAANTWKRSALSTW